MRLAALVLGAWAVFLLVRAAGPEGVVHYLQLAAPAIVWLVGLEVARWGTEVAATAIQLGRYVRPLGLWMLIRGHLLSYATNTLAPAGRVAGEVVKAASYSPVLGNPISAAVALCIQAASLYAGGAMSGACALVALSAGSPAWLSIGLVVHTIVAVGAGVLLLRSGRSGRSSAAAGKLRTSLAALQRGLEALPRTIGAATIFLFVGRSVQVAQMALLLGVLARVPTLADSLIMEGIFMIGTAAGDLIPGQLGATDAAFSFGASSFAVTASQGLAIAATIHVVQLAMAAVSSLAAMWPMRGATNGEASSGKNADVRDPRASHP